MAGRGKTTKGTSKTRSQATAVGPHRRWWRGPLWKAAAAFTVWTLFAFGLLLAWYGHDLPDTSTLGTKTRQPSVTLITTDDRIIASYGDLYGDPLTLDDLPDYLAKAVLATEDRRFYDHFGVDVMGVLRALAANIWHGEIRQGGSTVTQQLAKNLFLTPDRTVKRKVQETMLALWLERRFTKDEILTIYLNRVYFGAGTYGVDAAASKFFGKSARDLNLYEAAMLAGLLKAPSRYNPANDPVSAMDRADQVLVNMLDAGYVSEAEVARGRHVPRFRHPEMHDGERYFADWVLESVHEHVGFTPRDLVVVTTLDTELQEIAQQQLVGALAVEGTSLDAHQAALVAMSPNGAVRAMVGGRDYGESQFNRASQALRQPGSAFKLFVYLAGLQVGLRPDTYMNDRPIRIGNWRPINYTDTFRGPMPLREAVARSINTVAVQVSERAGRERVIANARNLGITTALTPRPSIALGTHEVKLVELTGAYAALANGGYPAPPFGIAEIRDRFTDEVIYRQPTQSKRLLPLWQVGALNEMFQGVIEWGTGKAAQLDIPAAGKTGTSQDWRDAWFVGYTSALVTGVWVGNDDNTPMNKVTGGSLPAKIWQRVNRQALAGVEVANLPGLRAFRGRAIAAASEPAPASRAMVPARQPASGSRETASATTQHRNAPPEPANNSDVWRGPASTRGIFAR